MKKINKKFLKEFFGYSILIFFLGACLWPFVYSMFFTLPGSDDFGMLNRMVGVSILKGAFDTANAYFLSWSGGWPYIFLECALNPIALFGLGSYWHGMEMIAFFILFLFSIGLLVRFFLKYFMKVENEFIILLCFVLISVVFINTNLYSEIYYWFVGSSYMWGVTFSLIATALSIKYMYGKYGWCTYVLLCTIGFIACMSTQCAFFLGVVYLSSWLDNCLRNKKILWEKMIPFGAMLLGGIISAFSPGTFARGGADKDLLYVLKIDVEIIGEILKDFFSKPIVIAEMLFFIFFGLLMCQKQNARFVAPIVPIILLGIVSVFVAFPLAYGYYDVRIPNRQYFMQEIYLSLGMVYCCIHFGVWLRQKIDGYKSWKPHRERNAFALICGILFLSIILTYISPARRQDLASVYIISNLEEMTFVSRAWKAEFEKVYESDDPIIYLKCDWEWYDAPILYHVDLGENPEAWNNACLARYLGKEGIGIEWQY